MVQPYVQVGIRLAHTGTYQRCRRSFSNTCYSYVINEFSFFDYSAYTKVYNTKTDVCKKLVSKKYSIIIAV